MVQCTRAKSCQGGEWFHQGCISLNDTAWQSARSDDEWVCMFCAPIVD
jgi:hypothetical protein